jgi:hypothetical protein
MKFHGLLPSSANQKTTKKMARQPGAAALGLSGKRNALGARKSGACDGVSRNQE